MHANPVHVSAIALCALQHLLVRHVACSSTLCQPCRQHLHCPVPSSPHWPGRSQASGLSTAAGASSICPQLPVNAWATLSRAAGLCLQTHVPPYLLSPDVLLLQASLVCQEAGWTVFPGVLKPSFLCRWTQLRLSPHLISCLCAAGYAGLAGGRLGHLLLCPPALSSVPADTPL